MKRLLLTLFLLLNSLYAMEWMSYDEAITKAKQEDKVVMVMLGRTTCGVCNYMKKVVFHDKKVIKKLDAKFISVYVELDFDDIPNGFTYVGTPTFYFVDKNQKVLSRFDGGKTVPSFLTALSEVD